MAQPGGAGPCRGQDREHLLIPRAPEKPALRIGLIGTGFMGKAHVFGYASAQKVFDLPMAPVLHTVADITEERAATAADAFGFARSTADWRTMIADPAIDAIHITAPNALHKEMALAAIAAGKHVHCEKPLAPTAKDAREMADAAEARGVKTQVGFNYLCNPMIGLAKQMIAAGELGEIRGYRGLHCEDYMADAEGPFTFRHEPAGGGALADIGSHALATAEFLLGGIAEVMGHCVTMIAERPDGPRPVAGIGPRQMPEGVRGPMKGGSLRWTPFRLRGSELRNRFVILAHWNGLEAPDGTPAEDLGAYYAARARGGVGLIVTGSHAVHPSGRCPPITTGRGTGRRSWPIPRAARYVSPGRGPGGPTRVRQLPLLKARRETHRPEQAADAVLDLKAKAA